MAYHIDTGLIKEKFKIDCECPLCEIQAVNEEQFLHEFLNDAVMEDGMRAKVNKFGFCSKHYDMLIARQNKLSVALQVSTRLSTIRKTVCPIDNVKSALSVIFLTKVWINTTARLPKCMLVSRIFALPLTHPKAFVCTTTRNFYSFQNTQAVAQKSI